MDLFKKTSDECAWGSFYIDLLIRLLNVFRYASHHWNNAAKVHSNQLARLYIWKEASLLTRMLRYRLLTEIVAFMEKDCLQYDFCAGVEWYKIRQRGSAKTIKIAQFKTNNSLGKWNAVVIDSFSCSSRPIWLSYFYETYKRWCLGEWQLQSPFTFIAPFIVQWTWGATCAAVSS